MVDEQMVMQIDHNAYMSKIHGMYDIEMKSKGLLTTTSTGFWRARPCRAEDGRRSAASLLLGWLWLAAAGREGDTSSAKAR